MFKNVKLSPLLLLIRILIKLIIVDPFSLEKNISYHQFEKY